MMFQILAVIAPQNFRDLEYIVPTAFLRQNNCKVLTASTQKTATGRFGYKVKNNLLPEEIDQKQFDGMFFVGGLGSLDFMENKVMQTLTKKFIKQDKVVGAICASPRNLLHWGVLKGERCTGHNWDGQFPELCRSHGAIWKNEEVIISGNFVTAQGPEASEDFALKLLELLREKKGHNEPFR